MQYLPNILTIFRLCLVPLFPLVYHGTWFEQGPLAALLIYILAGITDVLDGFLARRYDLITRIGTVLDPLADKLMLLVALLTLTLDRQIPAFILIFVFLKECLMIVLGLILYFRHDRYVIPSNRFGKTATALFFLAVVVTILVHRPYLDVLLFVLAIGMKLIAFTSYVKHYRASHNVKST